MVFYAHAIPQGTEQSTLCFPVSKLHLRGMNRNGGQLTSNCPAKLVQQKESKRSALPLCECGHMFLSSVNQVPRKCTHNSQSETASATLHTLSCRVGGREKKTRTALWHAMMCAYYSH